MIYVPSSSAHGELLLSLGPDPCEVGRAGGLASLFGGGKNNNNKRMAPSERRAKRYVDVGKDFKIGGN